MQWVHDVLRLYWYHPAQLQSTQEKHQRPGNISLLFAMYYSCKYVPLETLPFPYSTLRVGK